MIDVFKHWTIRSRIIALVAAPLLTVAMLITVYHTVSGINQDKENIQNNTKRLLEQFANAADLSFFAGDKHTLQKLANNLIQDSQFSSIQLLTAEGNLLVQAPSNSFRDVYSDELIDNYDAIKDNQWTFIKAVSTTDSLFSDDPELNESSLLKQPIGWVVLNVDLRSNVRNQIITILSNILITLSVTAITLWLAIKFSSSITTPISRITSAVDDYSRSDFSHSISEISGAELGQLEKGINRLAEQVSGSQKTLQKSIAEVKGQWHDAVTKLEDQNIDLIEAKVKAEEASHSKDDFLARMSHELRTPLTAIMGFVSILEKTDRIETRQEYIEMIQATSSVLLSTINDILDFSKLRSHAFKVQATPFNLENLLRNILDMHSVTAHQQGTELNLLIDSDVPLEIKTDVDKLKKAINNIVANAVKFTEGGNIIVFVSLSEQMQHSPHRDLITVEIKDTGQGIPKEHLKHLFDPFYQSDQSATRKHEGTGLGLSITKDFIELLGGAIVIESEVDVGTEVSLNFAFQPVETSASPSFIRNDMSILVFDDNPWTRRSWRNLLLKHTPNVTLSRNWKELLSSLPQHQYLLMGYNSSSTSKEELHNQLNAIRKIFKNPIMIAIADNGSINKEDYQALYAPLVITRKPLTQSRLNMTIKQFIETNTAAPRKSQTKHPTPTLPTGHLMTAGLTTPQKERVIESSEASMQQNKTSDSSRLGQLKILLAEDNLFNQRLFNDLLSAAGADVFAVADGQAALNSTYERNFDLLIFDLRMPHIDGIKLAKTVRQSANGNAKTPILLLTADLLSHQEDNLSQAGIDDICHKPINETEFFSKIQRLCYSKGLAAPVKQRSLVDIDSSELTTEINRQINVINTLLKEKDIQLLDDQIHQLSGILGITGNHELQEALNHLSTSLTSDDTTIVEAAFSALQSTWNKS